MSARAYRYRREVLSALRQHGIVPHPGIAPLRVYELLKSLYSFEIRGLRARHRELERLLGPQPLDAYRRALAALKERYPVLALPAHHWARPQPEEDGGE
jgi:hypothetical protein